MDNNNNKRKALGIGLEQLFTQEKIDFSNMEKNIIENATPQDIVNIMIDNIRSNPYQPRKTFKIESLNELAESIKEHGIIQPIIVKKSIKGYELVAGERRLKASKIAGLTKIPAIIRNFNDTEMMAIALIENIQREDLNPIDEARAYAMFLKNNQEFTQEQIAKKFGKSRSYITNMIGLMNLDYRVQEKIIRNNISTGHARALSKIEDKEKQNELINRIIIEKLSVRQLEELLVSSEFPKRRTIERKNTAIYPIYENIMRDTIGTRVKITAKKIEIPYDSEKDLERILEILNIKIDKE